MSCDVVTNFVLFFILCMDKLLTQIKARISEEIMSGRPTLQRGEEIPALNISVCDNTQCR